MRHRWLLGAWMLLCAPLFAQEVEQGPPVRVDFEGQYPFVMSIRNLDGTPNRHTDVEQGPPVRVDFEGQYPFVMSIRNLDGTPNRHTDVEQGPPVRVDFEGQYPFVMSIRNLDSGRASTSRNSAPPSSTGDFALPPSTDKSKTSKSNAPAQTTQPASGFHTLGSGTTTSQKQRSGGFVLTVPGPAITSYGTGDCVVLSRYVDVAGRELGDRPGSLRPYLTTPVNASFRQRIAYRSWSDTRIQIMIPRSSRIQADGQTPYTIRFYDLRERKWVGPENKTFVICP